MNTFGKALLIITATSLMSCNSFHTKIEESGTCQRGESPSYSIINTSPTKKVEVTIKITGDVVNRYKIHTEVISLNPGEEETRCGWGGRRYEIVGEIVID